MPVVTNLMVRAGADFSAISKQANKAKVSMSGMQTSVSRSCSRMSSAVSGLNKVLGALGAALSVAAIVSFSKSAKTAYDAQTEGEAKLAKVMRNTIGASNDEIKAIKDLTAAQQALGVIGDEVQLAGAQELATYVTMTSTLETLIPVMNDMVAQQYGLSASSESAATIATMLGKVLSGQTSALSRYGYTFTKAQEEILKFGTEAERAATLAAVVEQSVGGMNAALAATPSGRLKQVSNTLGDIKEGFGQAVTGILTTFLPALNLACSVLASMATLANKVAQAIANVFGAGRSSAATTVSYTAAAASGMKDVADEAKGAGKAAKELGTYSFDTLQKMSGTSSSGGGSGGADTDAGGGSGGTVSESAAGAEEAGESVGWLEKALARLKGTVDSLNFDNLAAAFGRLKAAAEPLKQTLFAGLGWAYDNIFEPLAHWTVESALPDFLDMLAKSATACSPALSRLGNAVAPLVSTAFEGLKWAYDNVLIPLGTWAGTQLLPAFLDLLAGAASALSAALTALQPLASWLWDNFLVPIATWTGGVIVSALEGLAGALQGISGWISQNEGLVQGMTVTVGAFFAVWNLTSLAEFIVNAGGLAGVIARVTSALTACTTAKIADKAETLALCAIYAKDWAVALAGNIAAIGKNVGAWVALKAEWISGKIPLIEATAAEAAHTVATWASTAATTAFKVATAALTSPITLVIAAIAALVAGIVLLVKNWDTVKATAIAVWEVIKSAWEAAGTWFVSTVVQPISDAWTNAMTSLQEWGSNAWASIKGVWSTASTWFTSNLITPLTDGFRNFANSVIGFFEGLANAAINGINSIINAFNKISFEIPDWVPVIGGKSWGFSLPTVSGVSLPRLAEGAVLPGNDPYLAVVNDQKHGTNIESPLSTIVEAMMIALQSVDFGDIQVDVRAVFDGQLAALARLLRPYFEADAKRVGNRASTAKGVV